MTWPLVNPSSGYRTLSRFDSFSWRPPISTVVTGPFLPQTDGVIGDVEVRPAGPNGLLAPPGCYHRAIAKDEEITIDDRPNAFDDDGAPWPCACSTER